MVAAVLVLHVFHEAVEMEVEAFMNSTLTDYYTTSDNGTHYTLHTTHYTLHTTHYTLHTTHYWNELVLCLCPSKWPGNEAGLAEKRWRHYLGFGEPWVWAMSALVLAGRAVPCSQNSGDLPNSGDFSK